MSKGGIRLFRAFGVAIHLDYSWFVFFFLTIWTFGHFYFPRQGEFAPAVSWTLSVAAAILLFASVTLHELSHALVSTRLGAPIRRITLFIFGGVAHMHEEPDNPRLEFLMAAAGPLASIALWGAFEALHAASLTGGWIAGLVLFGILARVNLALAAFNLVPGFPLDGGRLLRAAIWWKTGSLKKATNIAAKGGEIFAYLLMIFGVVTMFGGSFVGGIWYILIGIFVKGGAEQSYQHVLMEEVLEGIRVGDIMGLNPLAVHESDSLDSLIEEKFLLHKFPAYPVLDAGERVIGVVNVDDVRKIARQQREEGHVADVMRGIGAARLPRPSTHAMDALKQMLQLGIVKLPVVDESGRLAGIISRGDIMSMFEIRSDLSGETPELKIEN